MPNVVIFLTWLLSISHGSVRELLPRQLALLRDGHFGCVIVVRCAHNQSQMKALQYLDKIIHIPFCLPRISEESRLALLDSLLNGHDNSCPQTLRRLKQLPQVI